jgi:aspartyl-tRNA(Asn)/glutamyl-tRNA(Gln) amidotransferase subunit A
MGLAAIGTDTGGSIRIPAAACGLVGLKATTGEIPNDGVIPMSVSLDHVGPLARSVQDASWLCDVLAGRAAGTVATAPARGLRLTRLLGYFDVLDPYVRTSFEAALDRLRSRGVQTRTEILPSSETISLTYIHLALPETATWHAPYLDSRADRYVPAIHARISHGRTISAVEYLAAKASSARLRALVDEMLAGTDALVLPTLPIPAPLLGQADVVLDPSGGPALPVRAAMLKHTQLFNLTGHPAITIPVPASGLPVGLQLVGRRHDTARLLEIASACEAALA